MRAWVLKVAAATAACLLALAVLAGGTAILDGPPKPSDSGAEGTDTRLVTPNDDDFGSPSPTPKDRPSGDGDDQGSWWVLGLLGAAGAVVSVYLWRRRQPAAVEELPDDPDAEQVLRQATTALDEDGSPADAVIACWRDLERLAARQAVQRRDSETAGDFSLRLAHVLRLPTEPLIRLGELFERSWYSQFGSAPEDRAEAKACLEALQAAARGGQ